MSSFYIEGGRKLRGEITIHRAKNAVLPILAGCVLTDEEVILEEVPDLTDITAMLDILKALGMKTQKEKGTVRVKGGHLKDGKIPDELTKKIRSSIFLLGPLLAKIKKAVVPYPGGCEIGLRPIDLHLKGLEMLGAVIEDHGGELFCDGTNMRAGNVYLDYPSVGATENIMMAAVFLKGVTTIHHAAREPEIEDLGCFINQMGGKIRGAGKSVIQVEGAEKLRGVTYRAISDRIAAGTVLCAGAVSQGEIFCRGAVSKDLLPVTVKLREMGCTVKEDENGIYLKAHDPLKSLSLLQTRPHPGFPTDMQSQMMALCTTAKGCSVITENVFENRFSQVGDLISMGADIRVSGRTAVVNGVSKLHARHMQARDLRGGAALVIAALGAEGTSRVDQVFYIDRGYDHLENMLNGLGAHIERRTN